jgi:hypothetical protein
MKQTFSNRVYNGTSKQTAAAGDNFYITAIVGKADGSGMGTVAEVTVSFDNLTNLTMMDDKLVTFPFPIRTQDFTPSSATVTVVYYEGQ